MKQKYQTMNTNKQKLNVPVRADQPSRWREKQKVLATCILSDPIYF